MTQELNPEERKALNAKCAEVFGKYETPPPTEPGQLDDELPEVEAFDVELLPKSSSRHTR